MTMKQNPHDSDCSLFLDQLDAWLAGDCGAGFMQRHHDGCAACRDEAQLARAIGGITAALPQLTGPDIPAPVVKDAVRTHGLLAQALHTWRQPFVFAPALALVLALLAWTQLRRPDTAIEPDVVVIDGVGYTRDEIRKATADLRIALRYIERYRPARVISAELDTRAEPAPEPDTDAQQDGADAPTI